MEFMSPAFSNPDPQQYLEIIKNLEFRLNSIEKVLKPGGPASSSIEPQRLLETLGVLAARVSNLERMLDPNGAGYSLGAGNSSITVSQTRVVIHASEIELLASSRLTVKSSGELITKGARILSN
jgi:hypothetical protein